MGTTPVYKDQSQSDSDLMPYEAYLLSSTINYIRDNIKQKNMVSSLVLNFNMSRSAFYYKIKELSGQTPIELVNNVKLENVVHLIENHYRVTAAAKLSGFPSTQYMAKKFKDKYGMLPSEYRRNTKRLYNSTN